MRHNQEPAPMGKPNGDFSQLVVRVLFVDARHRETVAEDGTPFVE
jgi:hypothetical protein